MAELKDRQQQEMEGELQFHEHLMLMECMSMSESVQLKGSYVGELLYYCQVMDSYTHCERTIFTNYFYSGQQWLI